MSTTKKASEVQPIDLGKEIHVVKDGVDYAGRLSRIIAVETTLFPTTVELMVEVGSTSINFRLAFDDVIAILEDEPESGGSENG